MTKHFEYIDAGCVWASWVRLRFTHLLSSSTPPPIIFEQQKCIIGVSMPKIMVAEVNELFVVLHFEDLPGPLQLPIRV